MKISPTSIAIVLLGSALSAWAGWKIGQTSKPEIPASSEPNHVTPKLSAPAPAVHADYSATIAPDWKLRGGKDFAAIKQQILTAARLPGTRPDPVAMGLLGELNLEEAKRLLDELLMIQPRPVAMIGVVLARWAAEAGGDALAFAKAQLSLSEYGEARGRILEAWARRDPKAAHAWYLAQVEVEPSSLKHKLEQDFNALIYQWGLRNPAEAVAACATEQAHGTYDGWFGLAHLVNSAGHREPLFEAIGKMADVTKQKKAWGNVIGAWADVSPLDAAMWLESQPFGKDQNLQWNVIERWSRRVNPREAADYAIRNAEPTLESKDRALQMALPSWSLTDPKAAGEWLESVGATEQSIPTIANGWVRKDLGQAVDWVMKLPEAKRQPALGSIFAVAKQASPNFNPADWAARTGLSAEALTKATETAAQQRMGRF
jgi:hypothetical protein